MENYLAIEFKNSDKYFDDKIAEHLAKSIKLADEIAAKPPTGSVLPYIVAIINDVLNSAPTTIMLSDISSRDIKDIITHMNNPYEANKLELFNQNAIHKKYNKVKQLSTLTSVLKYAIEIYTFVMYLEYLIMVRCKIVDGVSSTPENILYNVSKFYNLVVCVTNPMLQKLQYASENLKLGREYNAAHKEQSKKIIDKYLQPELMHGLLHLDTPIRTSEDRHTIVNSLDSNILTQFGEATNISELVLPEIDYKLDTNKLKHATGLSTVDIYNVVNASKNLPVKFPILSRTSLNNQFLVKLRTSKTYHELVSNLVDAKSKTAPTTSVVSPIKWSSVQWNYDVIAPESDANGLNTIIMSVPMLVNKDSSELSTVFLKVNAIVDVEYKGDLAELYSNVKKAQKEYESARLDPKIIPVPYYIVPGSLIDYSDTYFTKLSYNLTGAHKVSIIFDLAEKRIIYYEPMNTSTQEIVLINGSVISGIVYGITYLLHDTQPMYFRDYSALDISELDVNLQVIEHVAGTVNRMDKMLINAKRAKIYKDPKIKALYDKNEQLYNDYIKYNRDFAYGYCGLWNYLLAFLLMVNPRKNLLEIFYMLSLIKNTGEYVFNFTKAIIRSFGNHIENMLDCKIPHIPLVVITKASLFDMLDHTNPDKPVGIIIDYLASRIKYTQRAPSHLTSYEDIENLPMDIYFSAPEIEYLKKHKHLIESKKQPIYAILPVLKDFSKSLLQSVGLKKRCDIKHGNTANTLHVKYMAGREKLIMFVNIDDSVLTADVEELMTTATNNTTE